MNKPTLSIVVPTFNESGFLPYLLKSIQKQTGVDFEIIIADNQSKDATRKIALSYGANIVDGGLPSRARNNGARAARADIVLFLDADVILPASDFLAKSLLEFEKRKLDVATCNFFPISKNTVDILMHQVANFYMKEVSPLAPHAPGFCIFVRKNIHETIGGFNEEVKLAEDHDYVKRSGKIARFGYLKSYPILVSVRRLERDGRFNVALKYILCEAHMILKGPVKSDIFKYRFGYGKSAATKKAMIDKTNKVT